MDTEMGFDAICDLNEAANLLNEAVRKIRAGALPGCGRAQNAVREAERAIEALTDALRQAGALE